MNWPSKEDLDSIDMSGVLNRIPKEDDYAKYIPMQAGIEHYRLLVWLGYQFNKTSLVEVGVLKGMSGCALSENIENKVTGFDLNNSITCTLPSNYTFIIGDVLLREDLIKNSPFIMYDTDHNGIHEKLFYDWLIKINYKGLLLFDDIHLNNEMRAFWNNIIHKKEDISHIGHITGTGVVWM
jgi:hypothetical protein